MQSENTAVSPLSVFLEGVTATYWDVWALGEIKYPNFRGIISCSYELSLIPGVLECPFDLLIQVEA